MGLAAGAASNAVLEVQTKEIERLKSVLSSKEVELTQVKAQLQVEKSTNAELNALLQQSTERAENLAVSLAASETTVIEQGAALSSLRSVNADLENQVVSLTSELQDTRGLLEISRSELATSVMSHLTKDAEMAGLRADLSTSTTANSALETALAENRVELAVVRSTLQESDTAKTLAQTMLADIRGLHSLAESVRIRPVEGDRIFLGHLQRVYIENAGLRPGEAFTIGTDRLAVLRQSTLDYVQVVFNCCNRVNIDTALNPQLSPARQAEIEGLVQNLITIIIH